MEDRIGRELRRNQLATRMVSHKARTQTICDYTGLARERIKRYAAIGTSHRISGTADPHPAQCRCSSAQRACAARRRRSA